MSKNIYRVSKKSDLDEIMKKNFYKPICIVFISKSQNKQLYEDVSLALLTSAKKNTYIMNILIDFDNFIDNINYFSSIKENIPYFIAYFKGKNILICYDKDNFIPIIINHLEQIHKSYVSKLMSLFNQEEQSEEVKEEVKEVVKEEVKNIVEKVKDVVKEVEEIKEVKENKKESKNKSKNTKSNESKKFSSEEISSEEKSSSSEDKSNISDSETQRISSDREKKLKELKKLQNMLRN